MTSGSLGFLALPSSSDHSEQKLFASNLPGQEVVVLVVASLTAIGSQLRTRKVPQHCLLQMSSLGTRLAVAIVLSCHGEGVLPRLASSPIQCLSLFFQNWDSMKSKGEWMNEEMRMRQSKQENPPNGLLGRKCSPLGISAEVVSFSQGFFLSLGTSAELHLCQLDISYDIGICRERAHTYTHGCYKSL